MWRKFHPCNYSHLWETVLTSFIKILKKRNNISGTTNRAESKTLSAHVPYCTTMWRKFDRCNNSHLWETLLTSFLKILKKSINFSGNTNRAELKTLSAHVRYCTSMWRKFHACNYSHLWATVLTRKRPHISIHPYRHFNHQKK
jgi:hypothetical protein